MKLTIEDVGPDILEIDTGDEENGPNITNVVQTIFERAVEASANMHVQSFINAEKHGSLKDTIMMLAAPKVEELVSSAFADGIQLTTEYGTPKGSVVPMKDFLLDMFKKAAVEKVDSYGRASWDGKMTRMQFMVEEAFKKFMDEELKNMVNAARNEIKLATTNKIAALIRQAAQDILKETGVSAIK